MFNPGERVRLTNEQEVEDMCPVQVGEQGIIISQEDDGLLDIAWDNYPEQPYAVWYYEVELVKGEDNA